MNKAIEQSQECVKQRETNLTNLQKQYNTLQYAYMKYFQNQFISCSIIAPSIPLHCQYPYELPRSISFRIFSFLDVFLFLLFFLYSLNQLFHIHSFILFFVNNIKRWNKEVNLLLHQSINFFHFNILLQFFVYLISFIVLLNSNLFQNQ